MIKEALIEDEKRSEIPESVKVRIWKKILEILFNKGERENGNN